MPALTSTHLQQVQQSVYKKYEKVTLRINKKRRPLLAWLLSIKEDGDFSGGSMTVNNTIESNLQETTWVGDDEIDASEPDFILPLEFGYFNFNVAIKILHDQLKRLGFTIMPNGSGKLESRAMSKSDGLKLLNYLKQLIFEASDAYDRRLDLLLHRTGAQATTVQPGLLGLLPQSATTGTIGGKSRSSYSTLQHQTASGMTTTAGGTMRNLLDRANRRANQYSNEGGVPGEVDRIFAGEAWIEGLKTWAENNNWKVETMASGTKSLDSSIPDDALKFDGVAVVWDPTLEALDAIETYSPTLTKTAFHLNSKAWGFTSEGGLHKYASSPQDPPNKRVTRQDLDGSYMLTLRAPASNAVTSIA
jgi:hypothetical protein